MSELTEAMRQVIAPALRGDPSAADVLVRRHTRAGATRADDLVGALLRDVPAGSTQALSRQAGDGTTVELFQLDRSTLGGTDVLE